MARSRIAPAPMKPRRSSNRLHWCSYGVVSSLLVVAAGCALLSGHASAPQVPADLIPAIIPVGKGPTLLAIAPDGRDVYAAANGTVTMIDTDSNAIVGTFPINPYPAGVAVTPDGTRVFLSNLFSIQLTVLDITTRTVASPLKLFAARQIGGFGRIAVSPNGRVAYVANAVNELLAIVDLRTRTALSSTLDMRPVDIAFAPDGRTAYIAGCQGFCSSGTVEMFDTATLEIERRLSVGSQPYRIVLAPDGKRAYTANLGDATVSAVDLTTRQVTATVPISVQPTGLALTSDGGSLYVTSLPTGTVTVIDTASNTVRAQARVADAAREVVVTPDGRHAYVSTKDSVVCVDTQALQ